MDFSAIPFGDSEIVSLHSARDLATITIRHAWSGMLKVEITDYLAVQVDEGIIGHTIDHAVDLSKKPERQIRFVDEDANCLAITLSPNSTVRAVHLDD